MTAGIFMPGYTPRSFLPGFAGTLTVGQGPYVGYNQGYFGSVSANLAPYVDTMETSAPGSGQNFFFARKDSGSPDWRMYLDEGRFIVQTRDQIIKGVQPVLAQYLANRIGVTIQVHLELLN